MKLRSIVSLIAVFLVSLIVAVSCTPSQPQTATTSNPSAAQPIRFGFSPWPGFAPWQVAEEAEIFEAHNLNVDVRFSDYLASIKALANGELDTNLQTLADTIISMSSGSKPDQVVILTTDISRGADCIVVRKGIDRIAELKGKKVALEAGSVEHFLLLLGLKKAGLKLTDVEVKNLDSRAAVAAFIEEQVDAVGLYVPYPPDALKRPGSKVLFSSKDFPGLISEHLVADRKLIESRPEDVQAIINTWFATLDLIRNNPEKYYQPMADSMGLTVEEFKKSEAGVKILSLEENLKTFTPGAGPTSLYQTASEISKFLFENGVIAKMPNVSQIFDGKFLKAYAASHSRFSS